jgi:Tol biopolymer transport system component
MAAWSPDGRRLAIDQYRDASVPSTAIPDQSVLIVDPSNAKIHPIGPGRFVGWAAPDHVFIAVESQVVEYDLTLDTGRPISTIAELGAIAPSPDGRWLARIAGGSLIRVDVMTGAEVALLQNPTELIDMPAWSPDSSWITVARTLGPGCHTCVGPLMRLRVDGSRVETISPEHMRAWRSAWAPDGAWVAFEAATDDGRAQIVVERAAGTEARTVALGQHPTWSPDGRRIWYLGSDALDEPMTVYPLFEVDPATGQGRRIDAGFGLDGFSGQAASGDGPPLAISSRWPSQELDASAAP